MLFLMMTYDTNFRRKEVDDGLIFFYSYGKYIMNKPCGKVRWKVLGTNINIARLGNSGTDNLGMNIFSQLGPVFSQ